MALLWGSITNANYTRVRGNFSIGRAVANAGMDDHILSLVSPSGLASGPTHMPKFLRIGVHQSNVSGYTSKAWLVRRVGSTVFLKWGAVEVHGVGDGRKIYWTLPPLAKTIRCGTVQRAKDYAKTAVARSFFCCKDADPTRVRSLSVIVELQGTGHFKPPNAVGRSNQAASDLSSVFASFRSRVSKPSVNHP